MDSESIIFFLNEYAPWGIFIINNTFKILFWNKWLEINTKIKKEDALNKDIFGLIPHTKKFENYFIQVLNGSSIILSQRFHKYLIPIEIKDEELKYMQQTIQMFPLTKENEIKGVIVVIEDVTERVKREEDYKKQIKNFKILNEIQKSILSINKEELIEKLFEGIIKISNAPKVALFLIENNKPVLKRSTGNITSISDKLDDPLCPINRVIKEKNTIYIPSIQEYGRRCLDPDVNSALLIPLLGKDDILGIILLESYQRDAFKKEDILNLETITMQGVIILEYANLFEALKESEERYRLLAEQSLVGVFVIQEEKVMYVNPRFVEIFGYPTELKTLNDFLNHIHEEDRERFKQRYYELLDKTFEYIIDEFKIKKGNDIAYIEMSAVGIMYKGKSAILGTTLDITYRKKMEEELKILSITDPLTGLYNRRGFTTLAEHTLNLAKRLNKKAIILFVDLDYMKWINDNLGHNVGDQALIDVANILTSTFRQNDLIARIGGDEFVILGIIGEENHKEKIIERLTEKVKEFNTREERPYKLFLSIGYVVYDPENPKTLEELLQLADQLMYEEKRLKKQNSQYPFGIR